MRMMRRCARRWPLDDDRMIFVASLTGRERDPTTNAVTTGVAANAAAGVAVVSFARLNGREREPVSVHLPDPITVHVLDPISVHCLDGHLLARCLRNTAPP